MNDVQQLYEQDNGPFDQSYYDQEIQNAMQYAWKLIALEKEKMLAQHHWSKATTLHTRQEIMTFQIVLTACVSTKLGPFGAQTVINSYALLDTNLSPHIIEAAFENLAREVNRGLMKMLLDE